MRKKISDARMTEDGPCCKKLAAKQDVGGTNIPGRHFVYMVECSDRSLYTGYTMNPARRLSEHNRGTAARYTRTRRPVKLVYLEEIEDRAAAMRREARIKKLSRGTKLRMCLKYRGQAKQG